MMNQYSIPIDLIMQISSRLLAKSVARFRCVSKLWASILGSSPYFTELFLTMSSTKLRLLFAVEEDGVWSFFSLPQLRNPYEKSLLVAEFHVKLFPRDLWIYLCKEYNDLRYFSCAYASGLIYLHNFRYHGRPLVYNPNTGLYVPLPYRVSYEKSFSYGFSGFEPIDKQYKALFMDFSGHADLKIHTLGRDMTWRKIKCSLGHEIRSEGVCINGVLYYLGARSDTMMVCFDLRSEKFTFIHKVEKFCRLIDYKGKLAVIFWEDDVDIDPNIIYNYDDVEIYSRDANDTIVELHVWVQEDVKKQEWTKYAYTCRDDKFFRHRYVFPAGVTPWGEIVIAMRKHTFGQPFYVFYFNPEKNTLRRVEIQGGFGETFKKLRTIRTFVNHVEDLNVNNFVVCLSMLQSRRAEELLKSVHAPIKKRRR